MADPNEATNLTGPSPTDVETRPRERASDPKLRALTDMILAMPIADRIRQIEAEASFFASVRPLD